MPNEKEKKSLFGALSTVIGNIFGPKDSGTTAPDYAGFTIQQLVGYYPDNLLNILEQNYRVATETDGIFDADGREGILRQETTVGWFIKLNKPTSSDYEGYATDSLRPSGISQLVFVQKEVDGVTSFAYKKYPVNVDLSTVDAANETYEENPDLRPTYHEFQLSQYQQDAYLNVIEPAVSKNNGELQFFEAGTNAIFFSRAQLMMMHRLLSAYSNKTILFTGCHYNLGRAGAQHHMYEFKYLEHTLEKKPTIPEWFTLKAELVNNDELNVNDAFYEQNTSPLITEDATLDQHLQENCNMAQTAKSAVLFLGCSCPPGWAAVAPALEATYDAFDSVLSSDRIHLEKVLCALLEEIKAAGHDGTGTP